MRTEGVLNKLLAAFVISSLLIACGEGAPPKTIKDISPRIKTVHESGQELRIELSAQGALRATDHFQNASMDTARITEKMLQHFPTVAAQQLVYILNVEVADKYGNQAVEPALELRYSMMDMRKVNFTNIYHKQILELAAPVRYLSVAGKQVVSAWCSDQDNRIDAKSFCRKNHE